MTRPVTAGPRVWTGFDPEFRAALWDAARTGPGVALRRDLESRYLFSEGKPFLLGPPAGVRAREGARFRRFVRAYHRAIETIVEASRTDEDLLQVLSMPVEIAEDMSLDEAPANGKVHIFRLDLVLDHDGGFWVLETNANCPGGFLISGDTNRVWRGFLADRGLDVPAPLRHEEEDFMARWVLDVAEEDTGVRPGYLALIREEGGNRFELDMFTDQLRRVGVESHEVDPRRLDADGSGGTLFRGQPVAHAYLKLGMREFCRMRSEIEPFVGAVRGRRLFVQNGQRGRWIGDNKLCLAVMSDPRFHHLFEMEDRDLLLSHIPWSRNASLLQDSMLRRVREHKEAYVLKHCLDTRGRGVVLGRECPLSDWSRAVDRAELQGWLVQEFHAPTEVQAGFDDPRIHRHDLALGAINGALTTIFMRSSAEYRVNMARSGRMHPVFVAS